MIFEPASRFPVPATDILSYVFSSPNYNPDKPVYIDVANPSRSISFNQAHTIVRQLIAGLRAWGVREGDCVAIHSFNDIYYSMLVLAIVGCGGVYTGTNPAYTSHEVAHHFRASETRFVLSEPEILQPILTAAKEVGIPEAHIRIFDTQGQPLPPGRVSWNELFNSGEEDWIAFDDLERAKTTPAARLFSSGTTGLPKAVTNTHHNMVAQQELAFEVHPRPYEVTRIIPIPLFHAAAAPSTHFGLLKAGHTAYMMRRFDLALFLAAAEKYQVTDVTFVPPIAIAVLMSPLTRTRPFLKSVKAAVCGAAPLDKDVQARVRGLLGDGAPFTQVWGMTELSCVATMIPFPEHDDSGSVGRLISNVEAKLVNDAGENISTYGVRGELCVRGPTVTPGYFKNAQANAEAFDDEGWFHTGDIAYCDGETRKWYIVDRKKELIKVRGFQVAPPELEGVLLSHPGIADAAVIGVKDTVRHPGTELPRAYVVRRPGDGDNLTEEEVRGFLEARLAKYKALTGGVRFVEAIPKNASGKILKRMLREKAQREIQAQAKL
ncbi:acyl--CoA ligase [Aspergillus lucknowensis]|uniref:AMP-binding enzyme n=1 Tax=Aspergillus lucknowensis TaxID=176173 RepID=A0ABR4L9J4_9EURO